MEIDTSEAKVGAIDAMIFEEPVPILGGLAEVLGYFFTLHPSLEQVAVARVVTDVPEGLPAPVEHLVIPADDTHLGPLVQAVRVHDDACGLDLGRCPAWLAMCWTVEGDFFALLHRNCDGTTLLLTDEAVVPADLRRDGTPAVVMEPTMEQPDAADYAVLIDDLTRWLGGAS